MESYAESRGKDVTPYFPRTGIFMCHHPSKYRHFHVSSSFRIIPTSLCLTVCLIRASTIPTSASLTDSLTCSSDQEPRQKPYHGVKRRSSTLLPMKGDRRLETSITRGRAQRKAPEETVQIARTRQTQPLLMSTSTRVPLEERPS